MSINTLTPSQLRQAADLKEKISGLENQLSQLLGSKVVTVATAKPGRKKFSAAARAKISAAQKARWAKSKGEAKPAVKVMAKVAAKPAKKARRKMSAEAKAKISAAAKARWAKVRAAKK